MSRKLKWYTFRFRVLFLVFIPVFLVTGYVGCRLHQVTRVLPMGSGPAGPVVRDEYFKQPWTEEKVVFIGLGDSITRGFGVSADLSYFNLLLENQDEIYPDMRGKALGDVLTIVDSRNYAQDYTVTQGHINNQLPKIPVYANDVKGIVVITSGGNDLIHDYGRSEPVDGAMYGCTAAQGEKWTENIKNRIRIILEVVNEKFPGGCEIFLANIYDPTDGVSDPQLMGLPKWPDAVKILGMTNEKIAALCNEFDNVYLVDIHGPFLGHGFHCREFWRKHYRSEDPTHWYHRNIEDPNQRGYDAIRRLFLNKIAQVLSQKQY